MGADGTGLVFRVPTRALGYPINKPVDLKVIDADGGTASTQGLYLYPHRAANIFLAPKMGTTEGHRWVIEGNSSMSPGCTLVEEAELVSYNSGKFGCGPRWRNRVKALDGNQ